MKDLFSGTLIGHQLEEKERYTRHGHRWIDSRRWGLDREGCTPSAAALSADRAVFEAGAFAWGAATTVENRAPTARGAAAAAAAAGNITGEGGGE